MFGQKEKKCLMNFHKKNREKTNFHCSDSVNSGLPVSQCLLKQRQKKNKLVNSSLLFVILSLAQKIKIEP